jgi:SSS family solute:Na+ symporter
MTAALLALYLAGMLAIGLFSRRRASRSAEAYFLADRSYGPVRGFVALASTTTGGSATLVCAALVYRNGLAGVWIDLAGAAGLAVLGIVLARRVRDTAAVTLPEIAGRFYGREARGAAGILVVLAEIAWFALLVEASQAVLTAAFGIAPTPALVASAAVFILYTSLGGQYAVIRTDFVQYGLMVAGVLAVGAGFSLAALRHAPLPAGALAFPVSESLGWREVFAWLVLVGLPHLVGGDVYAKLLSCRDGRASRAAALGAAGSKVLFGAGVAAAALAARARHLPLSSADQALPAALLAFAPPALAAFAIVALVATMQSSSDSVLLTAATTSVHDVAPAVFNLRPGFGAARWLVPAYGVLGLALALQMRGIVETLKLSYSFFAAGMILPILFGFFRKLWLPLGDAVAAMLAGGAVAAAGSLSPPLVAGLDPVLAGTGVNLAILLAAIARTRLAGRCPGDYGLRRRS